MYRNAVRSKVLDWILSTTSATRIILVTIPDYLKQFECSNKHNPRPLIFRTVKENVCLLGVMEQDP